ncbi:MAG TPA: SDR family oxidoreductase [Mycobacteriales bacterium]|nr:SDR family oxidoreductase [Mycobacteriales bacterium]
MTYFVTGATGFIGKRLMERLLEREGTIRVLVREQSRDKVAALWPGDRVVPVVGDLASPLLGVDPAALDGVQHVFHLAALYDMTATAEENEQANVAGTRNTVALANSLGATLHHVSSVAVAGEHRGLFREDHFAEGQRLPSPYHQTKYDAEAIVRAEATVPFRVYRPAVVVGDSRTGEMDKIDGPYYFFGAIKKVRHMLPEWVPLLGPELGWTNIVPVDFVAAALDHIAHQPGLDGQAFHLTDPRGIRVGEALNAFARGAGAPRLAIRVDTALLDLLPKGVFSMLMKLPQLREVRRSFLADLGIPEEVIGHMALVPQFDTRDTERALAGSGIEVPPLDSYAHKLWDYWLRHLDPDLFKDRSLRAAVEGKRILITGGSSGIGAAAAMQLAQAGGVPILVARSLDKLEEVKQAIEAEGGTAHVYSCDLSDLSAIDKLVKDVLADHGSVDVLVNNAGRSIRRSIKLSYDRFHDLERTMQLNYFGAVRLLTGLLPAMTSQRRGHVVNVSSIGVQTGAPRFSAYVASKAALDAYSRIAAAETVGHGVTFTTIHMPLVRTPMIAPTKMYDAFPAISPDEAGAMVCEAIRSRPKSINTKLGTTAEVLYALAPKLVDQVLHLAYQAFPDSAAAKGKDGAPSEELADPRLSGEQLALAHVLKGVHW